MATKSAKETGGLLKLDGKSYTLQQAVHFSFSERSGGGNNFAAYLNGSLVLIKLADSEKKGLYDSMAKRKYMDGELLTNEVSGSSSDHTVKLEKVRITGIDNYGDAIGIRVDIGKVTDGPLIAQEDWFDAVKK
ncbi:MAG: hypothetical protein U0X71_05660 [Sphingobacteriaceae bacterium]|nr:MAG: hypothetical protein E6Q66_01405 [Pedobacter sp.]